MIPLEVCLDADSPHFAENLAKVQACKVARIELCADMASQGVTPSVDAVEKARALFNTGEILVMIRPRDGDFCYSTAERQAMASSIDMAAANGADGVVLGVLDNTQTLARREAAKLINHARHQHMSVTFHRAFDAVNNPLESMLTLIDMGVSRVLTSGTPWESNLNAIEGLYLLKKLINITNGHGELVIGGGVSPDNAAAIVAALNQQDGRKTHSNRTDFSLHCYSSVLSNGVVNEEKLSRLLNICRGAIDEVQ